MEAWIAEGELLGRYPTRREAASALWAATATRRREIKATLESLGLTEWEPPLP
jgi:hypothetical protein